MLGRQFAGGARATRGEPLDQAVDRDPVGRRLPPRPPRPPCRASGSRRARRAPSARSPSSTAACIRETIASGVSPAIGAVGRIETRPLRRADEPVEEAGVRVGRRRRGEDGVGDRRKRGGERGAARRALRRRAACSAATSRASMPSAASMARSPAKAPPFPPPGGARRWRRRARRARFRASAGGLRRRRALDAGASRLERRGERRRSRRSAAPTSGHGIAAIAADASPAGRGAAFDGVDPPRLAAEASPVPARPAAAIAPFISSSARPSPRRRRPGAASLPPSASSAPLLGERSCARLEAGRCACPARRAGRSRLVGPARAPAAASTLAGRAAGRRRHGRQCRGRSR